MELLQIIVIALTSVALVYGLWLLRAQGQGARLAGEAAREAARLSLEAAQLQAQSMTAARAAIDAAARVQRLASRPVLKVALSIEGLTSEVGRTPVVFALRLQNVGHGTAVIEQVALQVRGEAALTYGAETAAAPAELARRIETAVFQRAVGASLQALSGKLFVTALSDEGRALEASGSLDLLRVQVYAHNADAVEQGLATLSAVVGYRDLDGGNYTSAEQFRTL